MKKTKKLELPKDFFNTKRPTISYKKATKYISKVKWVNKNIDKKAI